MENPITKFRGDYAYLSNFYTCEIVYENIVYKSVEHAYNAMKSTNFNDKLFIANAETPSISKKRARMIEIRKDWDMVKISIMKKLLKLKFEQEPFNQLLINTGKYKIIEWNDWGEIFWGIDSRTKKGKNMLGILLMEIRDELNPPSNKLGKLLFGNKK